MAQRVTTAVMPTKVSGDQFYATEAEAIRQALNEHADELEAIVFTGIPATADHPAFANAYQALAWLLAQPGAGELVLPMQVRQGSLYITATGVWASRRDMLASADPIAGGNWRLVAGFQGQASSVGSSNISDATDAGLRMLTALNAAAQRALISNPAIVADQYGKGHPAFTNTDGNGGLYQWLIAKVLALASGQPAPAQPVAEPVVTGFLPDSAPVGATVTITGTDFLRATSVLFNGTPASFQLINATTLIAIVPVGATTGPVSVATATATGTSAASFTVEAVTAPPAPTPALTAALAISVASIMVGSPLFFEVTAGGGTAPYSYAVKATNNATGAVTVLGSAAAGTFTPQVGGVSYNIDATVTDSAGKVEKATTRTVNVDGAAPTTPATKALPPYFGQINDDSNTVSLNSNYAYTETRWGIEGQGPQALASNSICSAGNISGRLYAYVLPDPATNRLQSDTVYSSAFSVAVSNGVPTATLSVAGGTSSVITGQSVVLQVVSQDADAGDSVVKNEFFDNGVKIGEITGASGSLQTPPLTAGSHNFTVRPLDTKGGQGLSTAVVVTAADATSNRWANAEILTILPTQSNGSGYSPMSYLTAADIAAVNSGRVGIWNKVTQKVEQYVVNVNSNGIPAGVTPGYEAGFGIDYGYILAFLADPANANKTLVIFKPYQLPPPDTDTNGASIAYWQQVTKKANLTDYASFGSWMVGQGYRFPTATVTIEDIGENDSFSANANYAADLTALNSDFFAAKIFDANTIQIIPFLQRAAGTQNDGLINAQKVIYILANAKAIGLSIPNPVYFDGTHFVGESQKRRGQEAYRLSRLSLVPSITSLSPASQAVGGQQTITGTNFKTLMSAKINSVNITQIEVKSDTQAIITIPAGAADGNLTVTTANGTGIKMGFVVATAPVGPTLPPGTFIASGRQFYNNRQMPNPSDGTALEDTNPDLGYLSGFGCVTYSDANVFVSDVFEMSALWYAEWAAPTNTGLAPLDIAIIEAATGTVVQQTRINPVGTLKKSELLYTMFNIVKGRYYARWNKAGGGVGIMDQLKASLV